MNKFWKIFQTHSWLRKKQLLFRQMQIKKSKQSKGKICKLWNNQMLLLKEGSKLNQSSQSKQDVLNNGTQPVQLYRR